MSGKPSSKVHAAMYLIESKGYNAKQAAQRVGIALSTIYRSQLYIAIRDEKPKFKHHIKGA